MQGSNYSFLDLTVMPFLRRKVISADAAILFDDKIGQILWANAVGTELFGGRGILDLLGTNFSAGHPLISQIKNAAKQLTGNDSIVRGFRISKGLKSILIQGELSKAVLPDGAIAYLMVCPQPAGSQRRQEHVLAELAVNSLEGFADAAAIVDEYGLTIAASSKFNDMAVNPDVLETMVKLAASENDRMVKRPIERADGRMIAAGLGRIRDTPGRYLIILADVAAEVEPELPVSKPSDIAAWDPSAEPPLADYPKDSELVPPWEIHPIAEAPEELPGDLSSALPHSISDEDREGSVGTSLLDRWYFADADKSGADAEDEFETDRDNLKESDLIDDTLIDDTGATADLPSEPPHQQSDAPVLPTEPTSTDQPLRFAFTIGPDQIVRSVSPELAQTVGPKSADIIGMSWKELASHHGFDENGAIQKLLEKADTWSGKSVLWPVQNTDMAVPIDLAALPAFNRARQFDGFRGFGIIRTADAIIDPEARGLRLDPNPAKPDTEITPQPTSGLLEGDPISDHEEISDTSDPQKEDPLILGWLSDDSDHEEIPAEPQLGAEDRQSNIFPIGSHVDRAGNNQNKEDQKAQEAEKLSQNEKIAFDDIRRRLQGENISDGVSADAGAANLPEFKTGEPKVSENLPLETDILGHLPFPVLVYREGETLFANDQLLEIAGYSSLSELTEAGGINSLLSASLGKKDELNNEINSLRLLRKDGTSIEMRPILKRVRWKDQWALCLTFTDTLLAEKSEKSPLDMVRVSDLENILDTATDGIIVIDHEGNIEALNASGEALFGKRFEDVRNMPFVDLFAHESKATLTEYLESLRHPGVASILNDGREAIGIEINGGMIPLFVTLGAIGQ